ncbi:phage holin family protein [Nocardioides sp. ChNu-153]|uniref:phage holin family protein n=1 Tax=unclassified Nocardioides TaxID=2615069 RepID=UPI0024068C61|nr:MULTISPECIES: phage holin family protein [unclassified Nocardioides]MDF9715305.1 phage holin family protein [Nocardioides sp. ChNu-99]MDN7122484.1 phage holin family protein [Nocardioides sp. ChNu-153]
MSSVRGDESTGELISRLSTQTSELVRGEIKLAQAEIARKVRYAGFGAAGFGAAALIGFFGLGTLIATIIIALDLVVPLWLAGLIVTLALLLLAGVLALVGKKQVAHATPAVPERTVENVKEDVRTVKEARQHDHTT